jgi:hypothetical protein
MKIKTNELNGAALDWAVALIEFPAPGYEDDDRLVYVLGDDEFHFTPSTNWSQGGPIIERESIGLIETEVGSGEWEACKWLSADKHIPLIKSGPTPLIAAMRCYVASRLGDEVNVPDELAEGATA